MQLQDLISRANEILGKYNELNKQKHRNQWKVEDLMAGFVGDVGDLSKIIMAKKGLRSIDEVDKKLAHELADCLWSVLVISSKYQIDIGEEFNKTMYEIEARIDQEK